MASSHTGSRTPLSSSDHPVPKLLHTGDDRIVWIDLEMTGLNPEVHTIVEIAAIITDAELNPVCDGIDLVLSATEEQMSQMNDFVREMHASSGLDTLIRRSVITIEHAEKAVLKLIADHCPGEHPILAGNSIATDRTFIRAQMPALDAALHYRMIDVSSVKELTRRWFPTAYRYQPEKGMSHRALADIIESIQELDYYRRAVFVEQGPRADLAQRAACDANARYAVILAEAVNPGSTSATD